MKTYKLKFLPVALKEWHKLGHTLKQQFKKKLEERLIQPQVESAKLKGFQDVYKIKLRASGYRLAYQVQNNKLIIIVIAVGKREKGNIYTKMRKRL